MTIQDFVKFFTRTTICYYMDDYHDNFTTDQHDTGMQSWGMSKFTLERDNLKGPVIITLDQIAERFMDIPRDNGYLPPLTRVIITKLNSQIDPKTQEVTNQQIFVGGSVKYESHCTVPLLAGLSKGVYVVLYQAQFTDEYPERKLVFSVYCNQPVPDLRRVSHEVISEDTIYTLDDALEEKV